MDSNKFEKLFGGRTPALFGDDFRLASYHRENDKLVGADIFMRFPGHDQTFIMTVQTFEHYTAKAESDIGDPVAGGGEATEDDSVYVLGDDEIFPSDLIAIKAKTYEELEPYLTPQTDQE
jgi:hypothetical protein